MKWAIYAEVAALVGCCDRTVQRAAIKFGLEPGKAICPHGRSSCRKCGLIKERTRRREP